MEKEMSSSASTATGQDSRKQGGSSSQDHSFINQVPDEVQQLLALPGDNLGAFWEGWHGQAKFLLAFRNKRK